jgi:hypothetical protein
MQREPHGLGLEPELAIGAQGSAFAGRSVDEIEHQVFRRSSSS